MALRDGGWPAGCFDFGFSLQGEIRITGFNQEVDKFYGLIEVGKVRKMTRSF